VRNDLVNFVDPIGLQMAAVKHKGGGGVAPTCLIDGATASCGTAFNLVKSGAGVIGPLNTTRWVLGSNQGQGGFEHFRVGPDGRSGCGYWEAVTERVVVDNEGSVLWQYGYAEWHWRMLGEQTIHNGEFAVTEAGKKD
jgi:hypothetical protein